MDEEWLRKGAVNDGHLALLRQLSFGSMLTVPLRYEQRLLGALTLFRNAQGGHFGKEDLALGAELARRVNAELREADRRKDEFLAMLGHERRNPLSPIFSALDLMRARAPDTLVRERTVIERQVQHLARLVDDLLDVSRITRGAVALDRKPVELSTVVAKAVELAQPLLEQRRHALMAFVPRTGLRISADEDRLAQVVANLLTNAAKYMDDRGVVTPRAAQRDGQVELQVEDRGVGSAPELLPRIFDLFVQGARGLDRPGGGPGVGLTIVKQLVELHGGTSDVRSEGPGRGSAFTVRRPQVDRPVVAPAEPPVATPLPPQPTRPPLVAAPRPGEALKLLRVDDNRDGVGLLAELLRGGGFQVEVALDGPAALQLVKTYRPEVAVLDIGLPVLDGYALAGELQRTHDFPLIAMTGYGQEADVQRAHRAGFVEQLVRPVLYTDLVQAVQRVARVGPRQTMSA